MEKLLLVMFALLGAVLLLLGQRQTSITEYIPAERTFKVGVSTSLLSSPIIIAERLGYFAEENLDVLLVPFKGGNACFDALIRFDVDLATSSDSVIMFNSLTRSNFVTLASFAESDNDIKLMMRKSEAIDNLAHLAGKRVGMVKGSASQYFYDTLLTMNGLNIDNVEVNIAPQEQGAALMAKAVDAISIWEPYGYKLRHNSPSQVVTLSAKGIYSISFNLIVRKPDNEQYQPQHISFLRALQRANEFMVENPQQAQQYVAEYLKVPLTEVSALWPDYLFRLSLDNTLVSNLNAQARWAINKGLTEISSPPDYRQYLDPMALNAAIHKPLVRTK
ncbi:hypothetical protein HR45_11410 [Shewanella mangrovi]|uniref:Solute-binding protein family 3/N-terminal domain-containing protein n=1 Tax=Shewanella mangrovi TaxID=1515746 RepID=A0A094JBH8_9GAMM|nr:ABC transporter substrate-binding protein [Shewanella mangrovi]KFZ37275.1 hypothetical protein HR45_11410 [Shewanella mangrovi]